MLILVIKLFLKRYYIYDKSSSSITTTEPQSLIVFHLEFQLMKRICLIGAGAAGLCALRTFTALNSGAEAVVQVTAYESSDKTGGTWVIQRTSLPGPDTRKMLDTKFFRCPVQVK